MNLSKMFKENFVLTMGILLPAILMLTFIIVSQVNKAIIDPPKYVFFYSANTPSQNNTTNYSLHFEIKDGKLYAKATNIKDHYYYSNTLYQYNPTTNRVEEVFFDKPSSLDKLKNKETETFLIKETTNLRFTKKRMAPDGYEYTNSSYYNRGIITGLFGGHQNRNKITLEKNSRKFLISPPSNTYYNQQNFIGWVVQNKAISE